MSISSAVLRLLRSRIAYQRPPDFTVGEREDPYLRRWWVIPRNGRFNIYLHHFCRSDDDRALHDHPYWNMSWLLEGSYIEHTPQGAFHRSTGQFICRRAEAAHQIELHRYGPDHPLCSGDEMPVWTLFITGPRIREWGFLCPKGWRHWKEFTAPADSGNVGRGCE